MTSSPLFKEEPRSSLPGGQSSDFPLARTATALGRNYKSHSRSVAQRAMSRYVVLVHLYGRSVFIEFPGVLDMSGQRSTYRGSPFLHTHRQ